MRRTLLVVPMILQACIAATPGVWIHPSATQTDFERDKYECVREATAMIGPYRDVVIRQEPSPYYYTPPAAAFGQGFATGMQQGAHERRIMEFAAQCMRARGYRQTDVPAATVPVADCPPGWFRTEASTGTTYRCPE